MCADRISSLRSSFRALRYCAPSAFVSLASVPLSHIPESCSHEIYFTSLLDKHFDEVAAKEGLSAEHDVLHAKEQAFTEALADGRDVHLLRKTWTAFASTNEAHLTKEEGIMMPKVMEFVKGGHDLKLYMKTELLASITGDATEMDFFVKYANDVLERHPEGMPRVRVFDHALWAVSTEDEWKVYDAWIKDTVSPKTYMELQEAIKG